MIPEEEWARAVDALKAAQEVAIACHVSPDGDAFGSMLGLGVSKAPEVEPLEDDAGEEE